ncbi:unnamed protein product [Calypogeia fissa]
MNGLIWTFGRKVGGGSEDYSLLMDAVLPHLLKIDVCMMMVVWR